MSDLGCLEAVLAGGLIGQSATGCTANKWSWARGFLGFTAPDQDQALGDENKRDGCTDRGDVAPGLDFKDCPVASRLPGQSLRKLKR